MVQVTINAGLDKDLKDKGVEWLNVFVVDNVLQQIADPVFGELQSSPAVSAALRWSENVIHMRELVLVS